MFLTLELYPVLLSLSLDASSVKVKRGCFEIKILLTKPFEEQIAGPERRGRYENNNNNPT